MIKALSIHERQKLIDKLTFYDLFTCCNTDGNTGIVFLSDNKTITFSDLNYTTSNKVDIQLYNKYEEIILQSVLALIKYFGKNVYVVNYEQKWMRDKRKQPKLNKQFKLYEISDNDDMLNVSTDEEICLITKSILRYNTFAEFVIPSLNVVITPTDHLDIFIATKKGVYFPVETVLKELNIPNIKWRTKN